MDLFAKKINIDLSICLHFHNHLIFCHALKEISKMIFCKTFKNFAMLDIAQELRIVTILLRQL